ncbi:MAG: PD-(D/E)XK nuclease family protein [Nanoarchaeota archaeon]
MRNTIEKISKHNKEFNLKFDEDNHRYTILKDIQLDSVTTRLKDFFPFDAEKVAREVAARRGVNHKQILEDWEKIRDNGTHTHFLAEKLCNGNKLCAEDLAKVKHVIQFLEDHPHFKILGCEIIIFSKKHKLAGIVDLILLNNKNSKLYILDWKTSNKEIEKDQYWDMAKGKLKELPHNKFYQYSLQVAVYMAILKLEYGIEVYDSLLIHLKNDQTYRVIEPTDLLMYVQEVLIKK